MKEWKSHSQYGYLETKLASMEHALILAIEHVIFKVSCQIKDANVMFCKIKSFFDFGKQCTTYLVLPTYIHHPNLQVD